MAKIKEHIDKRSEKALESFDEFLYRITLYNKITNNNNNFGKIITMDASGQITGNKVYSRFKKYKTLHLYGINLGQHRNFTSINPEEERARGYNAVVQELKSLISEDQFFDIGRLKSAFIFQVFRLLLYMNT